MSVELANAKWIDGGPDGLLGQFASTRGYSDLITATSAEDYPAMADLFEKGASENIDRICKELEKFAAGEPSDVASTAAALLELVKGQEFVMVTNGGS